MNHKCHIDIYSGEEYDATRHFPHEVFWSDGRLLYWGWLYDARGEIVGDFTAQTIQDAEQTLGAKFIETTK